MAGFRYDYYTISLPGDLFLEIEHFKNYAVNQAMEQTKLYCVPAEWSAKLVKGEVGDNEITFKVCRKRNK